MKRRDIVSIVIGAAALLAVLSLAPVAVVAQASAGAAKRATAKTWTPPRTPDGQPDLQGIWTIATVTPLQRPTELAGKEFFTEEEAAEYEAQTVQRLTRQNPALLLNAEFNEVYLELGKVVPSRRTSLIVDPPDGRVPPLTPEAQKRNAARAEARRLQRALSAADGPEDRSLLERCILGQAGPMVPMLPNGGYYQILQAPGYVVILAELLHEARIIPLDRRPHLPQNIRQWSGDSRGRWEGDTLVVDRTDFTDKINFSGSRENLHVVERFTRVDADMILYKFTADDPTSFTRPWTAEIPMTKTKGPLFEYACHEGNYAMVNILSGARAEERAAEEAANKK